MNAVSVCCVSVLIIIGAMTYAGEAPTASPPQPPVVLPMERTNYFIGEEIPIGVKVDGKYAIEVIGPAGEVVASLQGDQPVALRLSTRQLAVGQYAIRLNGKPEAAFGLASTLRESCAALTDEVVPDARKPEDVAKLVQTLKETGINAIMNDGVAECGLVQVSDALAATGTMLFLNPYTRPMSFVPARVYEPELKTFRHRLALMAQANARFPNFGGFMYDWDPTGFLGRKMLLFYWGWGQQEQALRAYIERSNEAIYADFRKRTGLEPVSPTEYIKYCLSIGHPEFAPAIDLPTHRWITEMAADWKPLPKDEQAKLEQRIDSWANYLMGIYGESYAGHTAVLNEIIPSLRHTASVNIDHAPVRDGQWHPAAYAPLDFRYMTTWNDQIAGPDYTYQWLFTAGILDIGRKPGQPVWLGSSLGVAHALAPYPGKFMRMAGHNLAYGGTGLGFALEGFSNVLGGMNGETAWANLKGKAGEQDLISGREFLKRFAPLAEECGNTSKVALLYSKCQLARQNLAQGMGTPQYNAFIALARLGYTPRFITEEQIAAKRLGPFTALVIVNQSVPLPQDTLAKLASFQKKGGKVFIDKASEIKIEGALPIDVAMPYKKEGRPHNWMSPNITSLPHALVNEQTISKLTGPMLAALGSAPRSALMTEKGAESHVSTFQLNAGRDATYVVAVNDAIQSNQCDWVRTTETLVPNGDVTGVMYDVTAERYLGPVAPAKCEFNDLTARVFCILPEAPRARLLATQKAVPGGTLSVEVSFVRQGGGDMLAAIPFCLKIAGPDGKTAGQFYRCTPQGRRPVRLEWQIPKAAQTGNWSVTARSLLDGATATIPITVAAGKPQGPALGIISDTVIARGDPEATLDARRLFVLPLFDKKDVLLPVAEALRDELGKKVEIRDNPAVTTYTVGYDPGQAELLENAQAEKGDAFGKIKVTTVNRNDYAGTLGGWIFGKDVILLDLVGVADNPMAEQLDAAGMLWPKASAAFPGPGKAIVQVVRSAFMLGCDAIVIQATDVNGLMAGVKSLRKPPRDWCSPGVGNARQRLFEESRIIRPIARLVSYDMSCEGLTAGKAPQPLAITFVGAEPPSEAKPFEIKQPAAAAIPAEFKPADATTYFKVGDKYEECWTPGGDWKGDLRFCDALLLKVDAKQAGKFAIAIAGKFRYNDRKPASQSTWEDLLAIYNAIPKQRKPASFDVQIDGKPAGSLTELVTGEIQVPVTSGAEIRQDKPQTAPEEAAVKVSGSIDIPAGTHDVLLIHRNMVDGKAEKISFGQ